MERFDHTVTMPQFDGWCVFCSDRYNRIYHYGPCPNTNQIKSVEFHSDGTIKRIEYKDNR